jgi:oligopeptide/dipeptide ABC transporter ATP-binding protein
VRFLCDRIAVMYLGRILETRPSDQILADPRPPHARALVAAVPNARNRRRQRVALPIRLEQASTTGCSFAARCPAVLAGCEADRPFLLEARPGRSLACHLERTASGADPAPIHRWC